MTRCSPLPSPPLHAPQKVTHYDATNAKLKRSQEHLAKRLQAVESDNAALRTRIAELESRSVTAAPMSTLMDQSPGTVGGARPMTPPLLSSTSGARK